MDDSRRQYALDDRRLELGRAQLRDLQLHLAGLGLELPLIEVGPTILAGLRPLIPLGVTHLLGLGIVLEAHQLGVLLSGGNPALAPGSAGVAAD